MRQITESCVVLCSIVFVLWLVLNAGVKAKVIWLSKEIKHGDTIRVKNEYGFQFREMDEAERSKLNTIAYWNNSDKQYKLIVTDSMLAGHDIQTYLQALYPQYAGGDIEQHNRFYYVVLKERYSLNSASYDRIFNSASAVTTYTITSNYLLTKNLDH